MQKHILLAVMICFTSLLYAAESDTISPGWGTLNYNVDQSPAFSILGINPEQVVQPTSAKSLALSVGNYYMNNGMTIPKNMAVEIAPLLMNPSASLNDFNKNSFWYRMRISVGTNVLDNGTYRMAEGMRFTIIDKSDLRTDRQFVDKIYKSCLNEAKATGLAIHEYIKRHPERKLTEVSAGDLYENDPDFKAQIEMLVTEILGNTYTDIEKQREKRIGDLWNATIWEAGLAAMQQSPDSLFSHLKISSLKLWSTYGTGFGRNSQLLIGCNFGMVDSLTTWHPKLSIGSRYYYGKNDLRYFAQAEYSFINNINTLTGSAGIVFNITNGVWGQVALNLIYDFKGNVSFAPGFNIGLGAIGKKNL